MQIRNSIYVLLTLIAAIGCGNHETKVPVVQSTGQYDALLEDARKLSEGPLIKFEQREKLSDSELTDLEKSYDIFQGLSEFNPTIYANFVAMGKIQRALGHDVPAMQNYQQALNLRPLQITNEDKLVLAECSAEIARILILNQRYGDAESMAHDAIEDAPKNATYYALLAGIKVQQKDIETAKKILDEAFKIDPENSEAKAIQTLITMSVQPETHH